MFYQVSGCFTRCVDVLPGVWMFYQVCRCFTRCMDVVPGVWMIYQVCGCFTRCVDALPDVWMFYQVCGCFTRSHLGVLGPARSAPAAWPRHGRGTSWHGHGTSWHGHGTPAPENCLSRTWPRHGRGTAPEKTVVHRPVLVGGSSVGDGCQVPDCQLFLGRFFLSLLRPHSPWIFT